MKKINSLIVYLIVAITIIISIPSCTEKIDIKIDNTDVRCVIYGEFTTDTTSHLIKISRSANYFSNKPAEPISGATLTITDGTNIFPLTESVSTPGSYFTSSNVYGIPGKTYTLNVSNVDLLGDGIFQTYTASSKLSPVSEMDSVQALYNSRWRGWEIKAWALDPASTEDYYLFKVSVNNVLDTDSLTNYVVAEDKFFNGSQTNGITVYFIENKDKLLPNDLVSVDICGITEDYFKFISEAQTVVGPQVPMFSGPPANVRTNLSNNAIGFFAAYSKSSTSCKVKALK